NLDPNSATVYAPFAPPAVIYAPGEPLKHKHEASESSAQVHRRELQCERGRIGDVQAFDRAGQVEACEQIAGLARELTQALAFGADHQSERRAKLRVREVCFSFFRKTDELEAGRLQLRHGA